MQRKRVLFFRVGDIISASPPAKEISMKRTKLKDRLLPDYTKGEETMNTVTHIVGGGLSIIMGMLCIIKSALSGDFWSIFGCCVYAFCMVLLYTMSSVYHGLKPGTAKKVLQVLDHCTIYFLISGTYTPILLAALRPAYPKICWGLMAFEWLLTAGAIIFTAIDLKRYGVFSMTCYIGMGWAIFPFMKLVIETMSPGGFLFLFFGGVSYTVGAALYGVGKKKRWMHSTFHIFVVLGTVLQFISIFFYAL